METLNTAVRLDERSNLAWAELAQAYEMQERYEKAAFCYEQAAEIKPNVSYYTMLANVQLTFDPESAVQNADKALEIEPGSEEATGVRNRAQELISHE
jgi:tetratricopeptide (TPR) repeat protein